MPISVDIQLLERAHEHTRRAIRTDVSLHLRGYAVVTRSRAGSQLLLADLHIPSHDINTVHGDLSIDRPADCFRTALA